MRTTGIRGATKALAVDGAAVLASQLLEATVATAVGIVVARSYGAAALGLWAVAMASVLAANTVLDLGASVLLTREVARARRAARRRTAEQVRAKVTGILILAAVAGLVATRLAAPDRRLVAAGLALAAATSLQTTLAAALRGLGAFVALGLAAAVSAAVQLVGVVLVVAAGGGLPAILGALAVGAAAKLAVSTAAFLRASPSSSPEDARGGGRLARRVAPFAGIVLLSVAVAKADLYLVTLAGGTAVTGVYAAAARIAELGRLVPGALLAALYPRFVRDERAASAAGERWLLVGAALLAATLALGARPFVVLAYGPGLAGAAEPLRLLALGLVPAAGAQAVLLRLYAADREGAALGVLGGGLAANLAAVALLVPWLGAAGAAAARVVTDGVLLVLYRRAAAGAAPAALAARARAAAEEAAR